jgi:hypothetical protein
LALCRAKCLRTNRSANAEVAFSELWPGYPETSVSARNGGCARTAFAGCHAAGLRRCGSSAPAYAGDLNNLGLLAGGFFPDWPGRDYELSPYLKPLAGFRGDFTVFSGVSHPDVDGSHASEVCFLTAAPHPANGGIRNSISLVFLR